MAVRFLKPTDGYLVDSSRLRKGPIRQDPSFRSLLGGLHSQGDQRGCVSANGESFATDFESGAFDHSAISP